MGGVFFLPCDTPENGLINSLNKMDEKDSNDKSGKEFFKNLAYQNYGTTDSSDIFNEERKAVHQLDNNSEILIELRSTIRQIVYRSKLDSN